MHTEHANTIVNRKSVVKAKNSWMKLNCLGWTVGNTAVPQVLLKYGMGHKFPACYKNDKQNERKSKPICYKKKSSDQHNSSPETIQVQ